MQVQLWESADLLAGNVAVRCVPLYVMGDEYYWNHKDEVRTAQ
jgi:hypothetical protein